VKNLAIFVLLINASTSVCNHTKLHHCALLSHHKSRSKVYQFGDASSFLATTGLSRQAYYLLHYILFLGHQPQRTDRSQLMHSTAHLGIFLFHIGSTMGIKNLCLILESPLPLAVKLSTKSCPK
jgi:hypothetical protein